MTSRFQQLLVRDSDEDTSADDAQENNNRRNIGSDILETRPRASATPNSAIQSVFFAKPPSVKASTPAHGLTVPTAAIASTSSHTATQRNQSIASSMHFVVEPTPHDIDASHNSSNSMNATSISFRAESIPRHGGQQVSSSQHSINFSVAASNPALSVPNSSLSPMPLPTVGSRPSPGSARNTPRTSATNTKRLSRRQGPEGLIFEDDRPHSRTSQVPAASIDGTTTHGSGASAASEDERGKGTKVVRRKVVVRRKKGAQSSDRGEVVRIEEQVIRPGRAGGTGPTAAPAWTQQPPPPFRVSPRSQRAAESRSASRKTTPAGRPRSPGSWVREAPPQIPTTRADSRGISPRTPRGPDRSEAERPSTGSNHKKASATDPVLPAHLAHPVARLSNRNGAPRSVTAPTETPIEFEVVTEAMTGTPNLCSDDSASFHFNRASSVTSRRTADAGNTQRRRRPQIPSPSALDDGPTPLAVDERGQLVPRPREKVRQTTTTDGRKIWMLYSPRGGDAAATDAQEIPAPPLKLSHRAQDILAAKRRALEDGAKKRYADSEKLPGEPGKRLSISRRMRKNFTFHPTAFYSDDLARQHKEEAVRMQDDRWVAYIYDDMTVCTETCRASGTAASRWDTEKVVRTLQPVQVAPTEGTTGTCGCAVYNSMYADDDLRRLIDSSGAREDGVRRYLNLQPMQLANVETQHMVDPPLDSAGRDPVSPSVAQSGVEASHTSISEKRGLATLGGLWCTVEALREDGRPAARKDMGAPRRILRICGGQAVRVPLHADSGETYDVRCYELLLFPRELLSPSAVNYGSEGLTLGQVVAPPVSSFPLTPRIIDDPITLKEYKKRLLVTKSRQVSTVNCEEDHATFAGAPEVSGIGSRTGGGAVQYLTLTMATISSRQKYTIDLTLVMLPFRTSGIFAGKTVAEVPRFCATTVMLHRRLQGLSLSFSTKSAFMSAYKALLWATECDIVDVKPTVVEEGNVAGTGYSKLRVCATTSPMVPWMASLGKGTSGQPKEDTFHGNCLDFAALTLMAQPGTVQRAEAEGRDPLTLEDFVITECAENANEAEDRAQSENTRTPTRQGRRSTIFTSTFAPPKAANGEGGSSLHSTDTVVGLTAFGVIRRAVSEKTSEVFDVRVIPRSRGRLAPTIGANAAVTTAGMQTAKAQEEHLLQQDAEAAIMIEYVSRLPFHSRVYGVLVDDQRYYIFQEPWASALSLEESLNGVAKHDALVSNEMLSKMTRATTIMSLKDFIHAMLRPGECGPGTSEEVQLEIARVLAAQLLLLIMSLHGKGMLLGPCPPQRLLVRVEDPTKGCHQTEEGSNTNTTEKTTIVPPCVTSSNIHLFLPDIGVNTLAWGYERQQCGVLEYLAPMYVLEQMLSDSFGKKERPWTMHDDWWTYLALCFELFAGDGSALVAPETTAVIPTSTPTLTKFFSPVEILDVWQKVITDSSFGVANTAAETIGMRTRRYVHQRVLKSVSRSLDSWMVTKAEQLQYLGTTAPRHGRRVVRAVPPPPGAQDKPIGVSLAAVYLKSAQEVSDTSSIALKTDGEETNDASVENILANMPWLFQVRDFFDTILDAVFSSTLCSVHGPALRLVSHPFFHGVQMADIFDGSHMFSAAVADCAAKHWNKSKVQAALLAYRTRAYRGLLRPQKEIPLMITSSAYNTPGRANSVAPLLMLSTPTLDDENPMREKDHSAAWQESDANPAEGLVFSRMNSMVPSAIPSPRSQSSPAGVWSQHRLKAMYDPAEWQSIAALETEVRGTLNSYGPGESFSRRCGPADGDYALNAVATRNPVMQPIRRYSGTTQPETISMASSGRRRDPREYEHVVDSEVVRTRAVLPQRSAYGSSNTSILDNATVTMPGAVFSQTNTVPVVQPLQSGAAGNSRPTTRQESPRSAAPSAVGEPLGSAREGALPSRRRQHYADSHGLEHSLNGLSVSHPHRHRSRAAGALSNHGNGRAAVGYSPGSSHLEMLSSQRGSRPSSHHSSRIHKEEYDSQRSWPNQFLDAATVQKKGKPCRLSDPQNSLIYCRTMDQKTQGAVHSDGPHSRHGGSIIHAASGMSDSQESTSDESYMLVQSDGEEDTKNAPMPNYQLNNLSRKSPAPCNPSASCTEMIASNRTSYFEF
ncbi:hypothetical protein, conserved [Leishmania tarentolae]|uniref:Protein kinase domain-containing protein n=1 Tax=Leishmania tarentolae TaxID=5689 RepID=A0A640KQH0_LEITA|nr:hypothetical protein, conserved [Leishmania tarentolae]